MTGVGKLLVEGELVGCALSLSEEYSCNTAAGDKVGLRMVKIDTEGQECCKCVVMYELGMEVVDKGGLCTRREAVGDDLVILIGGRLYQGGQFESNLQIVGVLLVALPFWYARRC